MPLQSLKQMLSFLGVSIGVATIIFGTGGWVKSVEQTKDDVRDLGIKVEKHISEQQDHEAKMLQTINDVNTNVKVLSTKIDDIKERGQGRYSVVTLDSIVKIKRHKL